MKCPKCKGDAPDFKTPDGQKVNFCRGCGGTWFDKGELSWTTATESDQFADKGALAAGRATGDRCTCCNDGELVEIKYHPAHDLLIDVCPRCEGVFLDAKETAKAEKIASAVEGAHIRLARALKRMKDAGYVPLGAVKGK